MIDEVLGYIHNYFEKEIVRDKFTISGGQVSLPFLQNGQYFRIVGSVFNDGVYQYPADELVDETFTGEIWAMAVPPAVIAIIDDISLWMQKYGSYVNSPYQSERFDGYSYSKQSAGSGRGTSGSTPPWASSFAYKLNRWRKIS